MRVRITPTEFQQNIKVIGRFEQGSNRLINFSKFTKDKSLPSNDQDYAYVDFTRGGIQNLCALCEFYYSQQAPLIMQFDEEGNFIGFWYVDDNIQKQLLRFAAVILPQILILFLLWLTNAPQYIVSKTSKFSPEYQLLFNGYIFGSTVATLIVGLKYRQSRMD